MKNWIYRLMALMLAVCLCLTGCGGAATTGSGAPSKPSTPSSSGGDGFTGEEYFLPKEEGYNQLTLYWDGKVDLSKADVWMWYGEVAGRGYQLHPCKYGAKAVINVPVGVESVGFIVRYDCSEPGGTSWGTATKDFESDRFAIIEGEETVIYLKKGDGAQYTSTDGGKTLVQMKKFSMAGMIDFNTIQYTLTPKVKLTSLDQVKLTQDGKEIPIEKLSSLNNEVTGGRITVSEKLDLSKEYTLEIEGYGKKTVMPTYVFDSKEFVDNYTYDGNDLGAVIHGNDTTFKVWAPTASKVVLNLFTAGNDCEAYANIEMTKGERGVWEHTEIGCGHGVYYTYTVTTAMGTQEATDPYAKAAGVNGNRSMVVDLDLTDPEGWELPYSAGVSRYTDAVIWEVHVRDFSNKLAGSQYPGKYLAFTETGLKNSAGVSVGMDYLTQLGVTHVHLLPVYDYATVDETSPEDEFNWGYDPKNYNVPEGSYSTNPYNGEVRINEFKQMVKSMHDQGLGVVMDVVYNHTYDANSAFNKIVPYYYYRYTSSGANSSASGCGNDTASERYMYGKFMVDSVTYWATEYKLDGFRFDLMGLHDLETMRKVEEAVHAVNPDAIIYGEGWTMGSTINNKPQANQQEIGDIVPTGGANGSISVFNDAIRDGLKGSVFEKTSQGYINGDFRSNAAKVQFGITGGKGSAAGWQVPGAAVINYMSAHDNNTLWDKLAMANADNTVEERLAMNRLGAAILMISQGTPFWQAGEEMLRSKPDGKGGFDENSYKSSDEINNINWEALTPDSNEYAMMLYYKGLMQMRAAYSVLRGTSNTWDNPREGDVKVTFGKLSGGGMTVTFEDAEGNKALVLINPSESVDSYTLDGQWNLVADDTRAGSQILATETGSVDIAARSVRIYVN